MKNNEYKNDKKQARVNTRPKQRNKQYVQIPKVDRAEPDSL